jgi:hypothetical protein
MGTFAASLRAIGDVKALEATVELSDGQLSIAAGATEIGSWPLSDIHLEEIPTGYRMAAEGEQLLIEFSDLDSFAEELKNGKKRRRRHAGTKTAEPTPGTEEPAALQQVARKPKHAPAEAVTAQDQAVAAVVLPPREPASSKPADGNGLLAFVDNTLARARKRFGAYLPDWVFSRAMVVLAFGALAILVFLPSLVSTLFIIAGALLVVFGAVVYSDPVLASRWLPGRTAPHHTLLFGVGILMLGVLVGLIAS